MSYVSLLRTIPGLFNQPTGIAAIASVGIHGAIAFILPLVPLDTNNTKESKTPKTVGLVELTQADQQRLPQTNKSLKPLKTLPPLPTQGGTALPDALKQNTPLQTPYQASVPPTSLFLPGLPQSPAELGIRRLPPNRGSIAQRSSIRNQRPSNPNLGGGKIGNVRIGKNSQGGNRSTFRIADSQKFSRRNTQPDFSKKLPSLQASGIPRDLPNNPTPIDPNQAEFSRLAQEGVAPPPETPRNSQTSQNRKLVAPTVQTPQKADNLVLAKNSQFSNQSLNTSSKWSNLDPNKFTRNGRKVFSEGELFAQAKKSFPKVETQVQTLSAKLNAPQESGKTNVRGALVVDGNGRIDFFKLQDNSTPSNLQNAVRNYFKQYFKTNPVKANGKPKYYSFNVAFAPSSGNPLVVPQASQGNANSKKELIERLQSIKNGRVSNPTPSVSQSSGNKPSSTQQSVNLKPQTLPKLKPLRVKPQPAISPIEVKKPSPTVEKRPPLKPIVVETKPQQSVRPSKPSSSSKATLTQRLRRNTNNSQKKKQSTLINKLRQVQETRETSK
ncbi:MAG: hypothetical protein AAF378_13450 [Cyanobacteria bacterium P01_A01_bin.84]